MGLGSVPAILAGFGSRDMAGAWVKTGVAGLFVRMTWWHQAVNWGYKWKPDFDGVTERLLGWLAGLRF